MRRVSRRVRRLARYAVDQPGAELGDFPAHGRLCRIGKPRRVAFGGEAHGGLAFRKTRDTALAFECERVAIRRINVVQVHDTREAGAHGADPRFHRQLILGVRDSFEHFATRYARFQDFGVVQCAPGFIL